MRLVRYVLTGAVALIVPVGFFGLVLVSSELGGEVITLHTSTLGVEKHTRLWIVDDAGAAWLRAGRSGSGWLARIDQNPDVLVERGGRLIRFRAVPVRQPQIRDRIHALMRGKYGLADRLVSVLRDPPQPDQGHPVLPSRRPTHRAIGANGGHWGNTDIAPPFSRSLPTREPPLLTSHIQQRPGHIPTSRALASAHSERLPLPASIAVRARRPAVVRIRRARIIQGVA